jgi:hypothetical protein
LFFEPFTVGNVLDQRLLEFPEDLFRHRSVLSVAPHLLDEVALICNVSFIVSGVPARGGQVHENQLALHTQNYTRAGGNEALRVVTARG